MIGLHKRGKPGALPLDIALALDGEAETLFWYPFAERPLLLDAGRLDVIFYFPKSAKRERPVCWPGRIDRDGGFGLLGLPDHPAELLPSHWAAWRGPSADGMGGVS